MTAARLAVIDPQDLAQVERLRALIGVEVYTDHLSNALAAFARGDLSDSKEPLVANDPKAILDERVTAVQRWLTAHGGCVDESDPDAQRAMVEGFILPLLAEAWAIGYQDACDEMGSTCLLNGPDDWRNPYVTSPATTCEHEARGCCGVRLDHDHGDCDGYIFTARDYWRGLRVALEHDAEEHVRTLYAHGVYKDHCGGYEVHAWPCFPASVALSDLRGLVGAETWARTDPFTGGAA